MDKIELRINDRASLPRFAEMNRQWIEELHHLEDSDMRMVETPEIYLENEGRVITAHIGETVVGAVALKPHQDRPNSETRWELTKMAVDPAFHKRGIGQVLLEEAHRVAREEIGVSEIFLLSNTKNAAALRLYERNGWIVNLRGTHPIYDRCNIGMVKRL